jgi:GST-like protein
MRLPDYPNLARWFDAIAARPAVERGLAVLSELVRMPKELSAEAREVLFGARQYERR